MKQFSLMEKIVNLFNTVLSSPFFIFLIVFFILLGLVLFDTIKYAQKKIKKVYVMIYFAIFIAIIIKYNTSLLQLIDYLIDNIFVIIYYPNFATYILMIIISNILVLKSVFTRRISKTVKTINIVFYCIKIFMMFLILDNITTNEIDVYSQAAVYTNNKLTMLVELSSLIFFIWIITLFLIWFVNKLTDKLIGNKKNIKTVTKTTTTKTIETRETPNQEKDIFSTDDYILMLEMIKLSKEDEYIREKLKERL